MKNYIGNFIKCIIFLILAIVAFNIVKFTEAPKQSTTSKLLIYGDNIDRKYTPEMKDNNIYVSLETISTFIDKDIFWDEEAKLITITDEDAVYKFKIDSKDATKNFRPMQIASAPMMIEEQPYIDANVIKDIYDLKIGYDEETDTISIDKRSESDLHLNYNQVKVYSDINTNSDVLEIIGRRNTVIVYVDSLKHNRWYKVQTDSGKIGYISKKAVTVPEKEEDPDEVVELPQLTGDERILMFWQYGNKLETLGKKVDGVSVVSPTWFDLGKDGSIVMYYSKDYYNKAKEYGYDVWPILSNGFNTEATRENPGDLTKDVLNNNEKRETLIKNIVQLITDYRLDGINIDFEGMYNADRDIFTQFLRELYPLVKETGAKLSVDMYFTGYMNRTEIGKACDYVIVMAYDQRGNWSNEAGSIAELPWVENQVYSLINDSNIPSTRIILGVPFYTKLWMEKNGELTTKNYTMSDSDDFVKSYNLTPNFDNLSGQNYVAVENRGVMYKLWIEDETSMGARADLVTKYNLGGLAGWQKGQEKVEIWSLLNEKIK